MTEAEVRAVFLLAGVLVLDVHKIENKYWPKTSSYEELRRDNPWWLVKTAHGMIEIGWRKRVISINWKDTPLRFPFKDQYGRDFAADQALVTDDVTKGEDHIHAYSYGKAVDYIETIFSKMNRFIYVQDFFVRKKEGRLNKDELDSEEYYAKEKAAV